MRHYTALILLIVALLWGISLSAQQFPQSIFFSGITTGDELGVLYQSNQNYDIIYYHNDGTMQSTPTTQYNGLNGWYNANIPNTQHQYFGFKHDGDAIYINPVYWETGPSNLLSKHTQVTTDPTGDQAFTNTNLDITAFYVSFSADKFHFAIKNAGGGFPTNSGLTNFSYMAIMVQPDADPQSNPPVFGLMYTVNLAGIIGPGLYKITGSGFSGLQSIGSIESTIDAPNNTLYLSCNRSDLESDPDFMAWYDSDYPLVGSMAITSRITLVSGIQDADQSAPANIMFLPRTFNTENASIPELSELEYNFLNDSNTAIELSVNYYDADSNYPLLHHVFVDDVLWGSLQAVGNLDFGQIMQYSGSFDDLPIDWHSLSIRFSDNLSDVTQLEIINQVSNADDVLLPMAYSLYPNPASRYIYFKHAAKTEPKPVIYNLKGQRMTIAQSASKSSDQLWRMDISSLTQGVYIFKWEGKTKRFLKLD